MSSAQAGQPAEPLDQPLIGAPLDPPLAGAPADPDDICWCCQGQTVRRHCKIVCTNCGFMRDCSDP